MKVGIKVGPKDGIKILSKTKAKYCEVWFRLDWQKKYTPLFKYLQKNQISFGLHFWATVDGKFYPNFLYLGDSVAKKTFKLIREAIDIAYKWEANYVNFHPESYRLVRLDLDRSEMKVLNTKELIDRQKSFEQLTFYLEKIKEYADKKRIVSFIETVPKYMPAQFWDMSTGRIQIEKSEGLETEKFFQLAKLGFSICFDIGHTTGQLITNDRKKLFEYLYKAAKKMQSAIGLFHVTTTVPPFNGVDSHNGILEKDFKQGALPDRLQLIKLLSLFKQKDVWLIPEPEKEDMIINFYELKKIIGEIEK